MRLFFWVTVVAVFAGSAHSSDLEIVTGSKGGTYIEFGHDMASVAAEAGLKLTVRESAGSLKNVFAVRYTPGVQLGIVQTDVLGFLKDRANGLNGASVSPEDRPKLNDLIDSIKLVFPLYIEEIHILATSEIATFADLEGKIVSVGKNGGGTFITSEQIFATSGISIDPVPNLSSQDAIELLLDGDIDAMIYVVGQPASAFNDYVPAGSDLHFLEIDPSGLLEQYDSAEISASSYDWLDHDVETVGVRSLLISYNYQGEENCQSIGLFASLIRDHLGELQDSRHEKWKDVVLDAPVSSWDQYACVDANAASAGFLEKYQR